MAYCYRCGRHIENTERRYRRRVVTGEFVRRKYPKPGVIESSNHYGRRMVCGQCAYVLDRSEGRILRVENAKLYAALLVLALIILLLAAGAVRW